MITWTEVLPQHAQPSRPAMEWTQDGEGPHVGFLTIHQARVTCEYIVDEFPVDEQGRGICLTKLMPGSDKTESHYCLRIERTGAVSCECKGFVARKYCKHADAVKAALDNRWL